jgi:hypothetical protein
MLTVDANNYNYLISVTCGIMLMTHVHSNLYQTHTTYIVSMTYNNLCNQIKYIYNIGVLTVNIEFMWRGLETGEKRAFSFY